MLKLRAYYYSKNNLTLFPYVCKIKLWQKTIFVVSIEGRENILMNLSENNFHTLSQFERQLCAIQGKMFELSAKKIFLVKNLLICS